MPKVTLVSNNMRKHVYIMLANDHMSLLSA